MPEEAEMRSNLIPVNCVVDDATRVALQIWAKRDGRSFRRHNGLILQRVIQMLKTNPEALIKVGLVSEVEAAAVRAA